MGLKDVARSLLSISPWGVLQHANAAVTQRRLFKSREEALAKYLQAHASARLQIGTGTNPLSGWYNTDLIPGDGIFYVDAREPLPFPSRRFEYVFSEHLLEHINWDDGGRFLSECYRVLKPGGKLRIATPNLRFLVELCTANKSELQEKYTRWSIDRFVPDRQRYLDGFVLNNFFYSWGHRFIYDPATLTHAFEKAGFQEIVECRVGESADENLRGLEAHGRHIPPEYNELETLIIEGVRKD